jgi:hypothetical protein
LRIVIWPQVLRSEFTANGMSASLRASAILPPFRRPRPAYTLSAAGMLKKLPANFVMASPETAIAPSAKLQKNAAFSKQNAAHFRMIKF